MAASALLYRLYERRLMGTLGSTTLPRHIGVMLDGNRRWAKELGRNAAFGHERGADKINEFLTWCGEVGVQVVTLWLLSTDNLKRAREEIDALLQIIAGAVERLAEAHQWRLKMVGNLQMLPQEFVSRLEKAESSTADVKGMQVNIAVGYGGRQEITDAVRSLLAEQATSGKTLDEVARSIKVDDITDHLYTKGQPDPDLVIRTSGEQRMSGFMLWQTVHTELYFCEAYWPDFRKVDFLRALRDYTQRERRLGR
mgnify:CR=1 FL=1